MAVRMFKVGDICVHKGYICRVDIVQRQFAKGLAHMGVKDGVEFNPVLTITPPITGPNGESAKKASKRSVVSGGVDTMEEAKKEIGKEIKNLQQKLSRMEQP